MDLIGSTELWKVSSSTTVTMPRNFRKLTTPEEHSSAVEMLLGVLRVHREHKDDILDSVFLDTVKYYVGEFDMALRQDGDKNFNAAMEIIQKTSTTIINTKPTNPVPYIVFFEAMVSVMPPAKTCADCKMPFHPHADVDKRRRCVYCM